MQTGSTLPPSRIFEVMAQAGFSFGDNMSNVDYSLANFDGANSLIVAAETNASNIQRTNFNLSPEYEHELNSLRLSNRRKKAEISNIRSKIETASHERKYVEEINHYRIQHTSTPIQIIERSNFFLDKRIRESDLTVSTKDNDYDFLYQRIKHIKSLLQELKELYTEEQSIGYHLKTIHISLVRDIVCSIGHSDYAKSRN